MIVGMRGTKGILGIVAAAVLSACGSSSPIADGASNAGEGRNIFLSAMPPGSSGNAAGGIGAPAGIPPALTVYPDHYADQLELYGNWAHAQTPMRQADCEPPANLDEHRVASDLACNYWKDAPIELSDADAVSTRTLTAPDGTQVTLRRDGWGVPYVDGQTRAGAQFGMGFAAAEDRLWLFDVLRNAGRGRASEYLGPAPDIFDLDVEFSAASAYSEAEITAALEGAVARIGEPFGSQFRNDTERFVDGMNAYIDFLQTPQGLASVPPEYLTLGLAIGLEAPKFPPRPFTSEDIVINAVLIQSALGFGGGGEAQNVRLLQTLDPSIGPGTTVLPQAACETWRDLRHASVEDAYHTASGAFPTQSGFFSENCPLTLPAGVALWDPGSFEGMPLLATDDGIPLGPITLPGLGAIPGFPGGGLIGASGDGVGGGGLVMRDWDALQIAGLAVAQPDAAPLINSARALEWAVQTTPGDGLKKLLAGLGLPTTSSNWMAVHGSKTASGHPILVGGPQTGYFNPQLLWEVAVISREGSPQDIAARGITTVNIPYVVIGRGLDYVWTPTSAGSDFTDTRVSRMCNLDGSAPSRDDANGDGFPDAEGYLVNGECIAFYRRLDTWTATPTPASIALGGLPIPQTVNRRVLRTHYGPVFATATVNGEPVAISTQRSTFLADVDAALPFGLMTTRGVDMSADRFQKLFNSMTATFNWVYADDQDIAYIQSGLYPIRHPDHMPELPVWGDGRFEWSNDQALPQTFFSEFGGNANDGAEGWPTRNTAVAQDEQGYFEWTGYLTLDQHIQDQNPPQGFLANWNNSGAVGWQAADSNGSYGPSHRVLNLSDRLEAFVASGRKFDLANVMEISADGAYTDTRGLDVLPVMLRVLASEAMTETQQTVAAVMQAWIDDGSAQWISGTPGLGAMRRDRNNDGAYDHRAAVVLMDAWYNRMLELVTPQLAVLDAQGASVLQGRLNAPGPGGSAFQNGWYQHMKRMFVTALGEPGPRYRQLRCAGQDGLPACRAAVVGALDAALADLGGIERLAEWDGSELYDGTTVEDHDAVVHTNFGFLPLRPIHWINRPTYHLAAEIVAPVE